jgi:hypothetical protein
MMLDSNFKMYPKLDYLHKNPVVAGYLAMPEHDVYSSEIDDAGGKGMIPIMFIQKATSLHQRNHKLRFAKLAALRDMRY